MKASVKRDLDTILRAVERLEKEFPGDEQMFYLLGSIRVNAEDAKGALEDEDRKAGLLSLLSGFSFGQ